MYDSDVMILTGAGASIPCDVPGMAGMAKRFKEDMEGTKHENTYDLLRRFGASRDVEEFLELSDAALRFTDDPVRKLVEKCVAPRGGEQPLKKFDRYLDRYERQISSFQDRMFEWITDVCLDFDSQKAKEIYSDIVEVADRKDIPIFTTNYDAVLDHVARANDIPVVDNFLQGDRGREVWDETLRSFHGKGLKIVKIHGSIQWYADPEDTIKKYRAKTVRDEKGPLTRLVIFPTRFKDIYQRNYFPLYSAFTRTLGQAKVLIVVGHSLRDRYLKAAIRERLRRGELSLIFIGPDFPAEDELKEGVRGQEERRIVYLNRKIEKVYPLLYQTLEEVPISEMRSHVRQASEDLSRGRQGKIMINDLPRWVEEGEKVEFEIAFDTVVGGGPVKAYFEPEKDRKRRDRLPLRPIDGGQEQLVVNGRKECERGFQVRVPEHGADSYRIVFELRGADDSIEHVVDRVFTIRG